MHAFRARHGVPLGQTNRVEAQIGHGRWMRKARLLRWVAILSRLLLMGVLLRAWSGCFAELCGAGRRRQRQASPRKEVRGNGMDGPEHRGACRYPGLEA